MEFGGMPCDHVLTPAGSQPMAKKRNRSRKRQVKKQQDHSPDLANATTPAVRSPLISVRKAGLGVLVPLPASLPSPVAIAMAMPDEHPDPPPGTFLTTTIPVSFEEGIENALSNPARVLAMAVCHPGIPVEGMASVGPDIVLHQLLGIVKLARTTLDRCSTDPHNRGDRVKARCILDDVELWVTVAMTCRSGGDAAAPLEVPQAVVDKSIELAEIGQRLRHSWAELARSDLPGAGGTGGDGPRQDSGDLPVLSKQQQEFRDIFLHRGPRDGLTGPLACREYKKKTDEAIDEGDFRSRIVPKLKSWGLKNERRVGYFFPEDAPARRKNRA